VNSCGVRGHVDERFCTNSSVSSTTNIDLLQTACKGARVQCQRQRKNIPPNDALHHRIFGRGDGQRKEKLIKQLVIIRAILESQQRPGRNDLYELLYKRTRADKSGIPRKLKLFSYSEEWVDISAIYSTLFMLESSSLIQFLAANPRSS